VILKYIHLQALGHSVFLVLETKEEKFHTLLLLEVVPEVGQVQMEMAEAEEPEAIEKIKQPTIFILHLL
jgi:hypothetical protein